jgi:hypothetical protein
MVLVKARWLSEKYIVVGHAAERIREGSRFSPLSDGRGLGLMWRCEEPAGS